MNATVAYLDSSAIIKRYLNEPGSNVVRTLYVRAYAGDVKIAFNLWNIGEVLGALDKARRLGRIDEHEHSITRRRSLRETRGMVKLGVMTAIMEAYRKTPHLRGRRPPNNLSQAREDRKVPHRQPETT